MTGDPVADILGRLGRVQASPRAEFADDLLEELLAELEGRPVSARGRQRPSRIWRRLGTIAAAFVPFLLALVVLVHSFPDGAPGSLAVDPRTAAITKALDAGNASAGLTVAGGSIWVGHYHGDEVWRIDPRSGRPVAKMHTGTAPIALAAGFGSVWSVNSQAASVSRIDPTTRSVTTIRLPEDPTFLAVGPQAIWVGSRGGHILRAINPRTNAVARSIDIGVSPGGLAYGNGALWATDPAGNRLLRIDPATGGVKGVGVGEQPTGLVVWAGAVWVADSHSNDVARVDPRSLRTIARIAVGRFPVAVAGQGGTLWVVAATDGSLGAVSVARDRLVRTIPLGAGAQWVHAAPGAIWSLTYRAGQDGVLYEVSARTS